MAIKKKDENKKSKLAEILKKEYKWESYFFFFISLVVLLIGVLILVDTITINETVWLIGDFPKAFAGILVGIGSIALLYAIWPFIKTAAPEFKHISWIKPKEYGINTLRVFTFLIVMALIFLMFEKTIIEVLARIWSDK